MATHNAQWQTYQKLEQIPENTEQSLLQQLITQLKQISREIIGRLDRTEPIVKQARDKKGRIWWYVYDPTTGRSAHLASEEEVLIWLDELFAYRQSDTLWNNRNLHQSRIFR